LLKEFIEGWAIDLAKMLKMCLRKHQCVPLIDRIFIQKAEVVVGFE
jgi:hypothetical protein